ncbi:MAG: hypothetical protein LUE89_09290 [Clostridiales bacterium]|nr:hypothetical protein [Clostridiales bacterium]
MNDYRDYDETTEEQVEDALLGILRFGESIDNTVLANTQNALSYREDGVLTMNRGVVLQMADGTEFQITIVQSR